MLGAIKGGIGGFKGKFQKEQRREKDAFDVLGNLNSQKAALEAQGKLGEKHQDKVLPYLK